MAENTKIEWAHHTDNLWWGCSKVHTGCKNCYAEAFSDEYLKNSLWGKQSSRRRIKSAFPDLDKYQKKAKADKTYYRVFCGSMMDIFEESKELENPTEDLLTTGDLRNKLFNKISEGDYNNLVFLFLTKRPENITYHAPADWLSSPPSNVWFGTSISDQDTSDRYVEILSRYKNNNLFLSIEPQIGPIHKIDLTHIRWVIQGGESGRNRRKFNLQWAYDMRDMCRGRVPYFFKQIDGVSPIPDDIKIREIPVMW